MAETTLRSFMCRMFDDVLKEFIVKNVAERHREDAFSHFPQEIRDQYIKQMLHCHAIACRGVVDPLQAITEGGASLEKTIKDCLRDSFNRRVEDCLKH